MVNVLIITLLISLSGCVLPRKDIYVHKPTYLKAKCKHRQELKLSFCKGNFFYTDKIQPFSKVRIKDKETGRSIVIATRKGAKNCIPEKYRDYFKADEYINAVVYTLRCGKSNVKHCPTKIKGYASWYGREFHGRRTASGKRFNMYGMYAAHRTLPLGTILEVKNLENGKVVRVKVIDRGPYVRGRHLDLSYGAAKKLGMIRKGVIPFEARVIRCGE